MANIVVVQPSVPAYRYGYFSRLSNRLGKNFRVYASPGNLDVLSKRNSIPTWEHPLPEIHQIGGLISWQPGASSIDVKKGDIVVVSGAPRCLSNMVLLAKARFRGATTIWWGHYWSSTSRRWSAFARVALMQMCDVILFYTDQERHEYMHWARMRRDIPIFALNNGIETDKISKLRACYSAVDRGRDLVFIGRISKKSKIEFLLDALAKSNCASITLDIIGNGDEKPRLQAKCTQLRLDDRVSWHEGSVDEEKIATVFNNCKLFVYPGAVGLSLIHALAYGLPCMVHDDRWQHGPEIAALVPGQNGFSFVQGESGALAESIEEALADIHTLDRMSVAAIETTEQTFNTNDMADRFCDMIKKLVDVEPNNAFDIKKNI